MDIRERDEKIYNEYINGVSPEALADRYYLSVARVKSIYFTIAKRRRLKGSHKTSREELLKEYLGNDISLANILFRTGIKSVDSLRGVYLHYGKSMSQLGLIYGVGAVRIAKLQKILDGDYTKGNMSHLNQITLSEINRWADSVLCKYEVRLPIDTRKTLSVALKEHIKRVDPSKNYKLISDVEVRCRIVSILTEDSSQMLVMPEGVKNNISIG